MAVKAGALTHRYFRALRLAIKHILKELLGEMWDQNHLDNACSDDDPSLSKSENRIRKDIIMNEMRGAKTEKIFLGED